MAAHWGGYKIKEFKELEGYEQAEVVALYRAHIQTEAVIAQEAQKRAERKSRQQRNRPGKK